LKILIIDDDSQNVELIKATVKTSNIDVVWAYDVETGLNVAQQVTPALVLLDLRVAGMYNGWDFARMAKQIPHLRNIPMIAVSVPMTNTDRDEAINAGCIDYVSKPFHIASLRRIISKYLATA
jgi:two-component system, cell cycle response regulator DivK